MFENKLCSGEDFKLKSNVKRLHWADFDACKCVNKYEVFETITKMTNYNKTIKEFHSK